MGVCGFAKEISVENTVSKEDVHIKEGDVSLGALQGEFDGRMKGVSPLLKLG